MRRFAVPLLLALAAVAPSAAQAAPQPGVNLNGSGQQAIDDALATGARHVRVFAHWSSLEPARGQYDNAAIAGYQRTVDALGRGGARAIIVVTGAPAWSHPGAADTRHRPDDPADFARFMAHFAGRLVGRSVAWEMWNEEDEPEFWQPAPDPAHYAAMARAAYPAIKAADPSATVLLGPTTGNNYGWLEQLYANGVQGSFDAVAVHTDTACLVNPPDAFFRDGGRIARWSFLGYREVRATMAARGDVKPIWMTEFGWSSTTSTCQRGASAGQKQAGVTEAEQAQFMAQAWHCLAQDDAVAVAAWFTLYDDASAPTEELRHYGLLRGPGGPPKPAWTSFRTYATRGDTLSGPCGDFDPPTITVLAPTEGRRFTRSLLIKASASDNGGVGLRRITFRADDRPKAIVNFPLSSQTLGDNVPVALDWRGARRLASGSHKITIEAVDANGNQSVQAIAVTKGGRPAATGRTGIRMSRVRCRGRRCTVHGRIMGPRGVSIDGKVRALWQARRGGRFRTVHRRVRDANRTFAFTQRLRHRGRLRVLVRYLGSAPLKPSARAISFRVR